MNNNNGALDFEAILRNKQLLEAARQVNLAISGMAKEADKQGNLMGDSFRRIGQMAGAYLTFQGVKEFGSQIIKVRNEFQQLEIAFGTMLKSKEKADELLKQVAEIAATTPFGLKDVANGTKMLLAYGSEVGNVKDEILMLGDIAAGVGAPINDIIYLFGTLRTQGRAYSQDIRQFAGRGIPIYAELAKVLGTTEDQVNSFVESGKVGFKEVEKALRNMTEAGLGQFAGLMEAQSKSIGGNLERLGDAFDMMLNDIGRNSEGFINGSIQSLSGLIENYETVGKILGSLIATYGAYKVAVMTSIALERIRATQNTTEVITRVIGGIEFQTLATNRLTVAQVAQMKVQSALNALMNVNPYIAIATAVIAIGTAMWVWHDGTTAQEKAQKRLNEENEKTKKNLDELKSSIQGYISTIQSQTSTELQRVQAYDELSKIAPRLTDSYSMMALSALGASKAASELNKEMDVKAFEAVQDSVDKSKDKINELEKRYKALSDLSKESQEFSGVNSTLESLEKQIDVERNLLQANIKRLDVFKAQAEQARINAMSDEQKLEHYNLERQKLNEQLQQMREQQSALRAVAGEAGILSQIIGNIKFTNLLEQISAIDASIANINNVAGGIGDNMKSISGINKLLKEAKDDFENATDSAGRDEANKRIVSLTKSLNDLEGGYRKVTSTSVKTKKAVAEVFDVGSLKQIDQDIQKQRELLERLGESQYAKAEEINAKILELQNKRIEAERQLGIRSFADELEQKKKEYSDYLDFIATASNTNVGATETILNTASVGRFEKLTSGGINYANYLERQINDILDSYEAKFSDVIKTVEGEWQSIDLSSGVLDAISDSDLDKFQLLIVEYAKAVNTFKTGEQLAENYIKTTREKAESEYDLLLELRNKLSSINDVDPFANFYKTALNTEIKEVTKSLADNLKGFFQSIDGHVEQIKQIELNYRSLIEYAKENNLDTSDIEKQKANELSEIALKTNEAYKQLESATFNTNNRQGHIELINNINDRLALLDIEVEKYGETNIIIEERQRLLNDLNEAQAQLSEFDVRQWSQWANIISDSASGMYELGGIAGKIGSIFGGLGSELGNLSKVFSDAKKDAVSLGDAVTTSLSFVIKAMTSIMSASKKRKEEEANNLLDLENLQRSYNQAIIEQTRLQSILSENVFFKNYSGRINDAISSASMSVREYSNLLQDLYEQEAKIGNGKAIDWGAVGNLAGAGATAGAAIGSIVPVIGTAIGAAAGGVIGAIAGLFSKKSKEIYAPLIEVYPELIDGEGMLNRAMAESLLTSNQLTESTKQWLQSVIDAEDAYKEAQKQITDIVSELVGSMGGELRDALVDAFASGEDAADSFANTVEKTLSNMLSNLIFSSVFTSAFDTLQSDLEKALGGDGRSYQEIFAEFLSQSDDLRKQFNELMKEAEKQGEAFGLDLFNSDTDGASADGSMSGIARSITEDTANVLVGQINGIRMHTADMSNQLSKMFILQNQYLPFLAMLNQIERNTRSSSRSDSLAEFGG